MHFFEGGENYKRIREKGIGCFFQLLEETGRKKFRLEGGLNGQ